MKHNVPYPRIGDSFPKILFDRLKTDLSDALEIRGDTGLTPENALDVLDGPQCINPSGEFDEASYKAASHHLLRNILRKFSNSATSDALKAAALKKFLDSENSCRGYNCNHCRESYSTDTDFKSLPDVYYRRARAFITRVLGTELPSFEVLTRTSRFGPGSNTDIPFAYRNSYFKYLRWPYGYPSQARDLACQCILNDERWHGALEDNLREEAGVKPWLILNMENFWDTVLRPSPANRVTFVPKTSTSLRTIAVESRLGVYLQLGVDGIIRKRLKRFGIDLDDQSRNRLLALEGSLGDHLATVDLSSASDTISLALVRELLPSAWYDYLIKIRSTDGLLPDGTLCHYEKISSMGNGYTFALESLIFASIVFAVVSRSRWRNISVYGDDIICPTEDYDNVRNALTLCGFTVNEGKSFAAGPFRESCGCDAWNGIDITPVYLRRKPATICDLYGLYNRLKRWFRMHHRLCRSHPDYFDTLACATFIRNVIPTGYLLWGPANADYPDMWLHAYAFQPMTVVSHITALRRHVDTSKPKRLMFAKLMASLRDQPILDPWDETARDTGTCFAIPGQARIVRFQAEVFTPQLV